MKTIFSSQDGKHIFTKFREYLYVWKSVFLFKSPSPHCSQTTGTTELHLPQISKVKLSQQNRMI